MGTSYFGENYLGVDWGSSKIGLAFADSETKIAFPLRTIKNDADVFGIFEGIIAEKGIAVVVVGVPAYVGQKEAASESVRFSKSLAKRFPVSVKTQNEMFTTRMAQANLIERGVKNPSKKDDAEAARIILQEWLDCK